MWFGGFGSQNQTDFMLLMVAHMGKGVSGVPAESAWGDSPQQQAEEYQGTGASPAVPRNSPVPFLMDAEMPPRASSSQAVTQG